MSDQFCSGSYLANRAADGREYPNTGPSPFDRVATRDEGCDDNGEPLCALPEDHDEPAPLTPAQWAAHDARPAPGGFHAAILGIVRSQHHLNTES
jgi:hypothetical protein